MKRRVWPAVLVLGLAPALPSGCKTDPASSTSRVQQGEESSSVQEKSVDFPDSEVLEVVFADLLASKGRDDPSPLDLIRPGDTIPLYAMAGANEKYVEQLLRPSVEHTWELTEAQRTAAKEAAEDLYRRARTSTIVFGEIRNARITTERRFDNYLPSTDPIEAWAPGYSDDGEFAVVLLSFPGPHITAATYLLCRTATGWAVLRYSFKFYA